MTFPIESASPLLPVGPNLRAELGALGGPNAPQSSPGDALQALKILDNEQEWSAFSRPDAVHPGYWESNVMIEACIVRLAL